MLKPPLGSSFLRINAFPRRLVPMAIEKLLRPFGQPLALIDARLKAFLRFLDLGNEIAIVAGHVEDPAQTHSDVQRP